MTASHASVPVNLLDELFVDLDCVEEPWVVHFEVRLGGRLDAERLAAAVATATGRHPIARVRLQEWRGGDLGYRWEIPDAVDVPLTIVECPDAAALAAARERLFALSPPLQVAPPFMLLLAHAPGGDAVMLNLHHGAADGVGAARLMLSILRAYAGDDDPLPPLDPLAVRDVYALTRAGSERERLVRRRALLRQAADRMAGPVARVARDGGTRRPGYGFELATLSHGETMAVAARRGADTTVNDLLLAALAVTIDRWNEAHDCPSDNIALTMPVNLRPDAWRSEVVGNFASYATMSLARRERRDLAETLEATARRTRRIKETGLAGTVLDVLARRTLLPVAVKRRLPALIPLMGDSVVDTASLSNLGLQETFSSLGGDLGGVEAVWFSPPNRMPLGASFGAATLDGHLHLTLRYRHAQFDAAAAGDFVRLYRDTLVGPAPDAKRPSRARALANL